MCRGGGLREGGGGRKSGGGRRRPGRHGWRRHWTHGRGRDWRHVDGSGRHGRRGWGDDTAAHGGRRHHPAHRIDTDAGHPTAQGGEEPAAAWAVHRRAGEVRQRAAEPRLRARRRHRPGAHGRRGRQGNDPLRRAVPARTVLRDHARALPRPPCAAVRGGRDQPVPHRGHGRSALRAVRLPRSLPLQRAAVRLRGPREAHAAATTRTCAASSTGPTSPGTSSGARSATRGPPSAS